MERGLHRWLAVRPRSKKAAPRRIHSEQPYDLATGGTNRPSDIVRRGRETDIEQPSPLISAGLYVRFIDGELVQIYRASLDLHHYFAPAVVPDEIGNCISDSRHYLLCRPLRAR